ncbi:hypothetical protein DCO49_15090 [Stenotrophomonas sp. SPM]|uniref:hypothetical protein n=1 Tax=unclassified Stenotrophomonas TaxID=196198 RepID=UPI000DE5F986|nr:MULTISPECIES: hypothetical protein [unclassified Stenotrophomonas]PWB22769.1 hypothetical protein DCO49_15090 [Stenotrophomonas sp. SPM]
MARVERAAIGMLTVAQMLRAAERCRLMARPERHLEEGVVGGLFMACRGPAELVRRKCGRNNCIVIEYRPNSYGHSQNLQVSKT